MKSLLMQEFEAARTALLMAATAVDTLRCTEAEEYLRSLRSICEVIIDLLEGLPDADKAPDRNLRA